MFLFVFLYIEEIFLFWFLRNTILYKIPMLYFKLHWAHFIDHVSLTCLIWIIRIARCNKCLSFEQNCRRSQTLWSIEFCKPQWCIVKNILHIVIFPGSPEKKIHCFTRFHRLMLLDIILSNKHNTICIGHHYAHTNTNNVNKTPTRG
jgi:hypothetical protein